MRFFATLLVVFSGCFSQPVSRVHEAMSSAVSRIRPQELSQTEFAMLPGEAITATNVNGTMKIVAVDWLNRDYTWEGATRTVTMLPRPERWYGSLGVYYPGLGNHWQEHHGITRGVVQEGQKHFETTESALEWLRSESWLPYVYNRDGLVVGWSKTPERNQLNVEVWQIVINGEKPKDLDGASDTRLRVEKP